MSYRSPIVVTSRIVGYRDDADREWAYDRDSHIGKLDKGLDESANRGWSVVSMKKDWYTLHPAAK